MRLQESILRTLRGVLDRSGSALYIVLSTLLIVVPWQLSKTLDSGEADDRHGLSRVVLEESWLGEGFADLAAAVRMLPIRPTNESIRRLMEELNCTDLHYGLRVSWRQRNGRVAVITYHRKPYDDLPGSNLNEFLDVLAHGPESTPRVLFDENRPSERSDEREVDPHPWP